MLRWALANAENGISVVMESWWRRLLWVEGWSWLARATTNEILFVSGAPESWSVCENGPFRT